MLFIVARQSYARSSPTNRKYEEEFHQPRRSVAGTVCRDDRKWRISDRRLWVPSLLNEVVMESAQMGLPVTLDKEGMRTPVQGSLIETWMPDVSERTFQMESWNTE